MRQYDRELVADRGMEIEAQVLEIIRDLREFDAEVSVREITNRLVERHGEDFGRKITPHWVGYLVRKKLGLKTEKRHGIYTIAATEASKLLRLFEKYGVASDSGDLGDSGDFKRSEESATNPEAPLIS